MIELANALADLAAELEGIEAVLELIARATQEPMTARAILATSEHIRRVRETMECL